MKKSFLEFCCELRGYKIIKNNKSVPNFIAYWTKNTFESIKDGKNGYSLRAR